ncbi:hypothetical protein GCM10017782_02480 [Deinococcus ficus]|nr:hypothetical protein GCM10017782_02480 [Deinococcus ficus]
MPLGPLPITATRRGRVPVLLSVEVGLVIPAVYRVPARGGHVDWTGTGSRKTRPGWGRAVRRGVVYAAAMSVRARSFFRVILP